MPTEGRLMSARLGGGRLTRLMPIICLDDLLNEAVTHDISLVEVHKLDAGNTLENLSYFDKPGRSVRRQVNLRNVSGHDSF